MKKHYLHFLHCVFDEPSYFLSGHKEHQDSFQTESNNFEMKIDQVFFHLYTCCFTG